MIYLLTAIGLSHGGRSTVHIYTQTVHRTIQNKRYIEQHNKWKSAGRSPSWLVIPWHLPYNRGKSTENTHSWTGFVNCKSLRFPELFFHSYFCLCILIVVYVFLDAATLTEVFPCFFLSCKANARV